MKGKLKVILLVISCLLLYGCGNTGVSQEEYDNAEEVQAIGEFERADFDKYNSYEFENVLKNSKIYVDGIVKEKSVVDNSINFILKQNDGNEWVVSVGITPVYTSEMIDELIGKEVRVFGKYIGFSNRVKMPGVHIMDENFENPELYVALLDENGEEKEIVNFLSSDFCFNLIKDFFAYDSNITVAELNGENGKALLISHYLSSDSTKAYESSEKIGSIVSSASQEDWFEYNYVFFDTWNNEMQRISSVTTKIGDIAEITQQYVWDSVEETVSEPDKKEIEENEVDLKTENQDKKEQQESQEPIKQEPVQQPTHIEEPKPSESITIGQKNALKTAKSYLDYSAFSYSGLIEQLEYEKYSKDEAIYAVDNCGADWNEQAKKAAKSYMSYSSFSKDGLIEQLEYEGFTKEQATYGAEANGY